MLSLVWVPVPHTLVRKGKIQVSARQLRIATVEAIVVVGFWHDDEGALFLVRAVKMIHHGMAAGIDGQLSEGMRERATILVLLSEPQASHGKWGLVAHADRPTYMDARFPIRFEKANHRYQTKLYFAPPP